MTRILIAGATGLVGSHVLSRALADERVTCIVAPTRRALSPHAKLVNPVTDFSNLQADARWWQVDGAVCTLGTTRAKAGSAEAFRAVDFHLQLQVARQARASGVQRFALTSSMGADPASRFQYLRTKGELEVEVEHLGWPSLTIVRPGFIGGERNERRVVERIMGPVLLALSPLLPRRYRVSPAQEIARLLLEGAVRGAAGTRIIGADQIA